MPILYTMLLILTALVSLGLSAVTYFLGRHMGYDTGYEKGRADQIALEKWRNGE